MKRDEKRENPSRDWALGTGASFTARLFLTAVLLAALTPLFAGWLSAQAAAPPTEGTLAAPTLSVQAVGATSITLSWSALDGAESYELYRWHASQSWWIRIGGALTATTYSDTGLAAGTYYYSVRAVNAGGASPWSDNVQATPIDPGGTQPPTAAPTLSAQAAGATSVTLTWSAVDGASGYELWRYDSSWSQVGGALTTTTYSDGGLTSGRTYYYVVRATNAAGAGPWSNYAQATPSASPGTQPPSAAPALSAQAAGATSVTLTWNAVDGASGYELYRWHDGAWTRIGGGLTATSYSDGGLSPATAYWYIVRAVNAGGAGPWSDYASATTLAQ